jgi:hypothetical protein
MPSTHVALLARRVNISLIPLNGWACRQHPPPVVTVFVVIIVVVAPPSLGARPPVLLVKEPQAARLILKLLALAV